MAEPWLFPNESAPRKGPKPLLRDTSAARPPSDAAIWNRVSPAGRSALQFLAESVDRFDYAAEIAAILHHYGMSPAGVASGLMTAVKAGVPGLHREGTPARWWLDATGRRWVKVRLEG